MSISQPEHAKQAQDPKLLQAKLNWASLAKQNSPSASGWDTPDQESPASKESVDTWTEQLQELELTDQPRVTVELGNVKIPQGAVLGYSLNGAFVPLKNVSYRADRQPEKKK